MTKVQSILFPSKKYSPKQARRWLKKNDFCPIKNVHRTKSLLRYRIADPKKNYKYAIETLDKDIRAVVIVGKK